MDILDQTQWLERLRKKENPSRAAYRAMYSSWWGGIVTDPVLMVMPMDDHQVHRGDGVFEAIKVVAGKFWLMKPHLDRLEASAKLIGLGFPHGRAEVEGILHETLRVSKLNEAIVRIFVSRGPGTFSPNPYDSVGPQFHVVVTEGKVLPASKYETGVRIGVSQVVAKDPWFARIKSCNYLQNVLMKKESVDRGFDFTVGVDPKGMMTESSTENLMILSRDGILQCPELSGILAGTTMRRSMQLGEEFIPKELLKGIVQKNFTLEELRGAREVLMVGTTLDVIAAVTIEDHSVGDGKPGPVAKRLRQLLIADQNSN